METISKQKLLDWIYNGNAAGFTIGEFISLIDLGYFDYPSNSDRLRTVLEFYADPATYDIENLNKHGYIIIDKDGGEKAREALSAITEPTAVRAREANELHKQHCEVYGKLVEMINLEIRYEKIPAEAVRRIKQLIDEHVGFIIPDKENANE